MHKKRGATNNIIILLCRTIYEKLAGAVVDDSREVYQLKCDEIVPSIRYCSYSIGDKSAINDLMQMRVKAGAGDDMTSKLDVCSYYTCHVLLFTLLVYYLFQNGMCVLITLVMCYCLYYLYITYFKTECVFLLHFSRAIVYITCILLISKLDVCSYYTCHVLLFLLPVYYLFGMIVNKITSP